MNTCHGGECEIQQKHVGVGIVSCIASLLELDMEECKISNFLFFISWLRKDEL